MEESFLQKKIQELEEEIKLSSEELNGLNTTLDVNLKLKTEMELNYLSSKLE